MGKYMGPTITVQGMGAGDAVSIRVSNLPALDSDGNQATPDVADDGVPVYGPLGHVTSDVGAAVGGTFTWMRAEYTAGLTPGTVTVMSQSQIPL